MKIMTSNQFQQQDKQSEVDRNEAIDATVLSVIQQVRNNKDEALYEFSKKFDDVALEQFTVTKQEMTEARSKVSNSFIEAIQVAKENITTFHEAQSEEHTSELQSRFDLV